MMTPSEFDKLLRGLAANERTAQVELLLALVDFDRHEMYLALGYDKLWTYCMKVLHLSEGSTYRRTHAIEILRRFPKLAAHLRDGRLNLSTLVELGPVLHDGNVDALTARAAYMSKTEVERMLASMQRPAEPPPELELRRAPKKAAPAEPPTLDLQAPAIAPAPAPRSKLEAQPIAEDEWFIRGRLSDRIKRKLERARELASHALPAGQWEAVLEAALDCYIGELEKRREARTDKPRGSKKEPKNRRTVPAEVRRAVNERDEGCCAWRGPDGHRCGSRWQLEYDHVDPEGPSTVENLRLLCRKHNRLHAEQIYGKEYMDQFRRQSTSAGESPRDLSHDARSPRQRPDASPPKQAPEALQSQLEFT
jgi:hypothetical protein